MRSLQHSCAPPRCSFLARYYPARTFSNLPRRRLLTAPASPAALGLLLPPPLVAPGASPSSPAAPAPTTRLLQCFQPPSLPTPARPPPLPHRIHPHLFLFRFCPALNRVPPALFSNLPRRRLLTVPPSPAALGLLLPLIWPGQFLTVLETRL